MIVLGLNAFGHDAAAVLLVDGRVAYASSEERFDRVRHSAAFPSRALAAALAASGLGPEDIDAVAFPWTRGMGRAQKLWHVIRGLPRTVAYLREPPDARLPSRLGYLAAMRGVGPRLRALGIGAPIVRVPHHLAHACSAALLLPGADGAVLTADGMGEWTTTATWHVAAGVPRALDRQVYPHSLGKTYSAVTAWLGFVPESDEGKTMGLAAYGRPDAPGALFARSLVEHAPRRLCRVDVARLDFARGRARLYGEAFVDALGPARRPDEPLRAGDADVARGIQDGVERTVLAIARDLLRHTGARHLGLAGGLFLNCALNGVLARGLEAEVLPFPVAGDAGAAWGAAACVHRLRTGTAALPAPSLFLGHEIDAREARLAAGEDATTPADLALEVARRVQRGELVGVARGRAELGPRALGARSVLASPTRVDVRDRLNAHKGRESWRPLAPVVPMPSGGTPCFGDLVESPWMILTFVATDAGRHALPGAIHADGTARVQTADRLRTPFLTDVLERLETLGHPPALLNTSLNRRGEPIVNTALEAREAARAMRLDALVLGDLLLAP